MNNQTNNKVPSYLDAPSLCKTTIPLAIGLTAILIATLGHVLFNAATLINETTGGSQLQLVIELAFMLTCTAAVWKHTIKR